MPWGWECRRKLIKQVPTNPTQKRGPVSREIDLPGPANYEQPDIFCGPGFSKIKRAPAYTFGYNTPVSLIKPAAKPTAPLFNVQGYSRKGRYQVRGGTAGLFIEPLGDKNKVPGPNVYKPVTHLGCRRPPAYTMRMAAKPRYEPWDMWTPSPNMYWPPIPGRKQPAFTFQGPPPVQRQHLMPSPGQYDANFNFCMKKSPHYSFGAPFRSEPLKKSPAPNAYCYKLFMANKRTIPAPTFGIKHSPYTGQQKAYLKAQDLQVTS